MQILRKQIELNEKHKPFVLATVVKVSGSVPGKSGFKMIIEPDRKTKGTVGGGAIELKVIEDSLKLMKEGKDMLQEYLLSADADPGSGDAEVVPMMCNGKVSIYFEVHGLSPTVYVFGGGHVGRAVLYNLYQLPFRTVLVDNREEFARESEGVKPDEIVHSEYVDFIDQLESAGSSYFVVVTYSHKYDFDIIRKIFERKIETDYIGVIASKSKAKGLKSRLHKELGSGLDISNLYSPIGLNIGGETSEEIALGVAAQIQSVRYAEKLGT